ncbi:hypothetical protein RR46_00674 [Papilio xuthus]|uniref:Uncharacterized protein n=1 Tax=Papilio xuthus TaxID=66420 RepID=A0A0N1PFH7_PAPXU|nr:hypothetical protein RR46_00674 [Papilio xuthus]
MKIYWLKKMMKKRLINCIFLFLQEEKKSLKERLQAIQEVTQTVQNAIGYVASLGEAVKNIRKIADSCCQGNH